MTSRSFLCTSFAGTFVLAALGTASAVIGGGSFCPDAANDCFTTGGPGCSDVECCEAVCGLDPFCCETAWDTICVGEAFDLCGAPECPFDCPPDAADEGEPCGDDTNGGCNPPLTGSSCCSASGGIGCDDAECQDAVCAIDPFCCETAWDGTCAAEAADLCPELCAFEPAFTPIVCGETICGTAWAEGGFRDTDWFEFNTDETVEITITVTSQLDVVFGVIDTGGVPDCSLATTINPFAVTGFCGTGTITACLGPGTWWLFVGPNGFEGFPCDSGNNNYFISLECGGECVPPACGNPDSGDCFSEHGPFCDDAECCETVCAVDPFCCQTAWDAICVDEASIFCIDCDVTCDPTAAPENEECGQDTNGGCNAPIVGSSTCCFASGGIGCDDPDCQDAVCLVDAFCCETAWDGICASEAADLCPDLCAFQPAFEDIDCGVTICGTGWAQGGTRDTDWFEITFDAATEVTFCGSAEFPLVIGIVDTGGIPDCALASVLNPFATANPCQEVCFTACLNPGTYWFFVAPSVFDGFPCGGDGCCGADLNQDGIVDGADLGDLLAAWGTSGGCADLSGDGTVDGADLGMLLAAWNTSPPCETGGSNVYTVTLTCSGECVPPACGDEGSGDCFTIHETPFCDDAACCETVCAADPFCCNTAWDGICVDEAVVFCQGGSNCCFPNGGLGCDDQACQDTVCAVDAWCCETSWDGLCAEEAAALCEVCGGDPKQSNCCFASFGLGCDDEECTSLICGADEFCCNTEWDQICADAAVANCAVCQ